MKKWRKIILHKGKRLFRNVEKEREKEREKDIENDEKCAEIYYLLRKSQEIFQTFFQLVHGQVTTPQSFVLCVGTHEHFERVARFAPISRVVAVFL